MPERDVSFSLEELQKTFLAFPPLVPKPPLLNTFPPAPLLPANTLPGADDSALPATPTLAAPYSDTFAAPGFFNFTADPAPAVAKPEAVPANGERPNPSAEYADNLSRQKSAETAPRVKRHGFLRFLMCVGIILCVIVLGAAAGMDGRIAPQSFFGIATYMTVNLEANGSLPAGTLYFIEPNAASYQPNDIVLLSVDQSVGTTRVITSASAVNADGGELYYIEGDGSPYPVRGGDIYGRVVRTVPELGTAVQLLAKYRPWFAFFGCGLLLFLIIARLSLRTKRKIQH
ncbi:MAG: hypothetical protein LBT21_04245 [Oscillospiraceae bacterium]|jgi:hypothetical protein|nr:hypothetical protein [Oscillospiraceae bacterium]